MQSAAWKRYAACVPLPLALGAVAQRLALAGVHHGEAAAGLAQPLPVVTHWGAAGAWALAPLVAAIVLACIPYALAVRAGGDARIGAGDVATIVVAGCAGIAASWCWAAVFSSDMYAYATYGDLTAHGFDPFVRRVIPQPDAIVAATAFHWGNPPPRAVYGPLFVALVAAIVSVARGNVVATLWALRGVELLAFAGAVVAYAAALRVWHHPRPLAATCALALNPLVLWTVAEGHNDVIAFALAATVFALALRAPFSAGIAGAAAAAVKATGLLPAIAAVPLLARRRGAAWKPALMGTLAGLLVTAAGYAILLHLPAVSDEVPQAVPGQPAGGTFAWLLAVVIHRAVPVGPSILTFFCAAIVGLVSFGYAYRLARRRDPAWIGMAAIGILLSLPQLYPWYAIWTIGLAALSLDAAGIAAIVMSTATVLLYAAESIDETPAWLVAAAFAVSAAAPLAFAAQRSRARPAVQHAAERSA